MGSVSLLVCKAESHPLPRFMLHPTYTLQPAATERERFGSRYSLHKRGNSRATNVHDGDRGVGKRRRFQRSSSPFIVGGGLALYRGGGGHGDVRWTIPGVGSGIRRSYDVEHAPDGMCNKRTRKADLRR